MGLNAFVAVGPIILTIVGAANSYIVQILLPYKTSILCCGGGLMARHELSEVAFLKHHSKLR